MKHLLRTNYKWAITEDEIQDFINTNETESSDSVRKIQNAKKRLVELILSGEKITPKQFSRLEDSYLKSLWELKDLDIETKTSSWKLKQSLIDMDTPQTVGYLGENSWYIKRLEEFEKILNKYIGYPLKDIQRLLWDELISREEKEEIRKYLSVMRENTIENTRKRILNFDSDIFNQNIENIKPKNIECFYEEDFEWNKNYFSLDTLLNYTETFWIEIWLPEIKIEDIPENIRKKYFPSTNRKIKTSIYKNLLQDLRDKQEVLMYDFDDYEKQNNENKNKKEGFIAEKIVELEFRRLAGISDKYNISITKASIWEDQKNKVDLFISLKDKKTWISVKEELQITLKENTEIKQQQIKRRNHILQKSWDTSESQLVEFTMSNLSKKIHTWRYFNRPIWKLSDTLDATELSMIRETFRRLVNDLKNKVE